MYGSKAECANDVYRMGLVTMMDHDEMLTSDFDLEDRVFIVQSDVETEVWVQAGFAESTRKQKTI